MADAVDSKSTIREDVWVQVPSPAKSPIERSGFFIGRRRDLNRKLRRAKARKSGPGGRGRSWRRRGRSAQDVRDGSEVPSPAKSPIERSGFFIGRGRDLNRKLRRAKAIRNEVSSGKGGPEGSPIAGRSSSAVQVYGKNLRLDVWSGGRWTWRSIFDRCC